MIGKKDSVNDRLYNFIVVKNLVYVRLFVKTVLFHYLFFLLTESFLVLLQSAMRMIEKQFAAATI